jgi:hypothetical protein
MHAHHRIKVTETASTRARATAKFPSKSFALFFPRPACRTCNCDDGGVDEEDDDDIKTVGRTGTAGVEEEESRFIVLKRAIT